MSAKTLKLETPLPMVELIKSVFEILKDYWELIVFGGGGAVFLARFTRKKYPALVEFTKTTRVLLDLKNLINLRFDEINEKFLSLQNCVDFQTDVSVTPFWRANAKGQFIYVNDAFCSLFNKEADDLLGDGLFSICETVDFDRTIRRWERAVQSQSQTVIEFHGITCFGVQKCKFYCYARFDSKGEFVEFQGITQCSNKKLGEK